MFTHLDLFSGIGGFALAAKSIFGKAYRNIGHSEIDRDACKVYHKHFEESKCLGDIQKISLLQQDSLARMFQLQGCEKDLPESELDYSTSWQELLKKVHQLGLSSKMFPDYSLPTKGMTWHSSLKRFPASGIAWGGECLMLNTSEWHKDVNVCGLSEVLETSVPSKYYLSKKAVAGMIRRSKGKNQQAYVFLQETGRGTTPRMKRLSLKRLQHLCGEMLEEYGKILTLRKLTPKEKERLMGFPEGWTADLPSDGRRGKGLGNAIVPQVAEAIMQVIKETT